MLADDVSEMPKNWNRRFKHNRDKIKTGDIYELAEVVRNLAVREQDKGLSTGEKQMYTRAKKILASEMMYALEKTEDEAEAYLDEILLRTAEQLAAAAPSARIALAPFRPPSHPPAGASGPVALLVAAGSGARLGAAVPKAFVEVAGRPMLEWSLDALRAAGIARDRRRAARGRRRRLRACVGVRGGATRSRVRARRAGRRAGVRPGRRPRRRAAARRARAVHARRWRRWTHADCAIAAARVTDTVKEADERRRGRRHARPLAAVGGPDAAGLPPRGAGGARWPSTRRSSRAPPTTPGWSSAPAAPCGWSSPRPRTSRSPRRTTCGWPTSSCANDADRLPRPSAPGRPGHLRRQLLHRRQRRALPRDRRPSAA